MINRLQLTLDARGFTVYPVGPPTEEERLHPLLWRFWLRTPTDGRIAIFDRSWYGRSLVERVERLVSKSVYRRAYDEIVSFERQLADGGTCFVKLFLHIDCSEQRKRFRRLESSEATSWKVGRADWRQNRRYEEYSQAVEDMLAKTSTVWAPWTVIPANRGRTATLRVFESVAEALRARIQAEEKRRAEPAPGAPELAPVRHPGILSTIDLSASLERDEYERELDRLQRRLRELEHEIHTRRIGVVVAYEGWDAAGKGGNIRRVVQGLDPRGFTVVPVAAPNDLEKAHHYLWRFWRDVPEAGHIAIFDRSWYGRVLVERVEGFCTALEWSRAYGEINDMEKQWTDSGIILVKFWLTAEPGRAAASIRGAGADSLQAVEDHQRGLEKPGEVGSVRSRGRRHVGGDEPAERAVDHRRIGIQAFRSDQIAPHPDGPHREEDLLKAPRSAVGGRRLAVRRRSGRRTCFPSRMLSRAGGRPKCRP